ncbi:MAG: alpha/beta hydrolase fold domain-containing protein [Saprospiraceae bacterium]|nr:alpha/beta hydrolase fold domain-containing protein [Saprospiraceae bacterium]
MKNNLLVAFVLLFVVNSFLNAQNAGCDGSRYIDDVFTTVKKTSTVYGPATTHLGQVVNMAIDIYEPEGDALGARPVVVLAHGGSFVLGNKTDMKPWCELLAKKGYVAASIQYRLYPFVVLGFPASMAIFDTAVKAMGDMKAAVRFFREDAATNNLYKVDVNNIFVGGYSAGAVTALHTSYFDVNDEIPAFLQTMVTNNGGFEGNTGSTANKTYYSGSKAVINMSGGLYRSTWIDANESPLVSIHGTADGTVNYNYGLAANIAYLEGSKLLHDQANAIGLWNQLTTVPGGDHGDIYTQPNYQIYRDSFWNNATTLMESLTCAAVGTTESELRTDWAIAPNPINAGDALQIMLPDDASAVRVRILDALGKVAFEQNNVRQQEALHCGHLANGVYSVEIQAETSMRFAVKKLIVSH